MKLKPEIQKAMDDKSTDYIDWDELKYGDRDKSGIKESNAFREGFMYAVGYLSSRSYIKGDMEHQELIMMEEEAQKYAKKLKEAILTKKYYIGNPSAWEKYSEEGSEHLRDLLKEVEK